MTLAFDASAEREINEAYDHHERERPGYGELLIEEVERVVARAERFPRSGPRVRGFEAHDGRAFGLPSFPYSLIVARISETFVVVAFAHQKRAPGYWQDRLR